jgi:hypothetical protein
LRVQIERYGDVLYRSEPIYATPGYGYIILPPIELPPNYLLREVDPARLQVCIYGLRMSGAATTLDIDCLTIFPLSYAATFYGFINMIYEQTLIDDSFRNRFNILTGYTSGESVAQARVGGPLMLFPNSHSRMFFYCANDTNLMPIAYLADLKVYYYPTSEAAMTLYATIYNRDFSTQPIRPLDLRVNKLTWSAFGGPDEAILSAGSTADRLLEYASLLRCPIMIAEDYTTPSWWGFIDRITIRFESFQYEIDLDNLYNWVKVKYSFISPDNKLSEQYETTPASNAFSYGEYGYREIVLYRKNIDDDFAIILRDTFFKNLFISPGHFYAECQAI